MTHASPVPSSTVTVPRGVPLPGSCTASATVIAIGAPCSDGLGVSPVMLTVVVAGVTASEPLPAPELLLACRCASPAKLAVTVYGLPATVGAGASTQVPDALSPGGPASVAMHELAPACTFTEPEGWRAPAVAVTVAVTLTSCP